ncbi:uncharacterized protein [Anabrus simplex]|uniref:uncharacterized protein n=1 Tax=Anabrus simplex TaxID=316456 RepID=UPI0035A30F65
MAAVKSKPEGCSPKSEDSVECLNKSEVMSFRVFDMCIVLLSLGTFIADLSTDIILVVSYFNHGHLFWAVSTLLLVILPATVVQMFSMRWHIIDEAVDHWHWIAHIFLMGIVHRYVLVLKTGFEARSSGDPIDFQRLYHQQSDICMLRLFESFMESAPQLVLQLYIMITMEDWRSWTGISAAVSLGSLAWAVAAYTRAMRRARPDKKCVSWPGLALQATWHGGMVTARITTLVLFAIGFRAWLFLLIGIHWVGMTVWIIFQKTDFCQTPWEERIYNCVVGVIYCFCFFNLQEGQSRRRALAFYIITVTQNIGCLGLFIGLAGMTRPWLVLIGVGGIVGGTILGVTSMLLYYRFFHPAGPIKLCTKNVKCDIEHSTPPKHKPPLDPENMATIRSLKHLWHVDREGTLTRINDAPCQEDLPHTDDMCTDKKLLLTHWSSCQSSIPSDSLERKREMSEDIRKQKRRGICSPQELEIELDGDIKEMEISEVKDIENDARKQKRRGICSLEPAMELELSGDMGSNGEVDCNEDVRWQKRRGICSSIGIELELDVVGKDDDSIEANSKDIEYSKDEAEESSALKQNALRLMGSDESPSEVLSVPSEVLSAHDYENMCAVNIAREAWGLRSWRAYSDIETWLHDDSVVRDRRRDTLTSTATTLTSASSEHSAGSGEPVSLAVSPPPIPCRRPRIQRSRQDDYLDTLVDDLADCETIRPLAEFVAEPDIDQHVFIARPYVIDQHGTLFPLTTLDTIMEELEESSTDTADSIRHWQKHGSASTLVATIDEIRHGNSICNLYNSTDPLWDGCGSSSVDAVPRSLMSSHCRSHLSPEEVLFLSQLQPSSDTGPNSSPNHSPPSGLLNKTSNQNLSCLSNPCPVFPTGSGMRFHIALFHHTYLLGIVTYLSYNFAVSPDTGACTLVLVEQFLRVLLSSVTCNNQGYFAVGSNFADYMVDDLFYSVRSARY